MMAKPNYRLHLILLLVLAVVAVPLMLIPVNMPVQAAIQMPPIDYQPLPATDISPVDLSEFSEGGAGAATYITDATPYRTLVEGMPLGVEAYRYKDYGAGYFDGNFTHYIDARIEAYSSSSKVYLWGLSSSLGSLPNLGVSESDVLAGGTATASHEYTPAGNAVDNNTGTYWSNYPGTEGDAWWKYDLGAGNSETGVAFTILPAEISSGKWGCKSFVISGSNNDSDYTQLYSGQHPNDGSKGYYPLDNDTAYRYYKLTFSDSWYNAKCVAIYEFDSILHNYDQLS